MQNALNRYERCLQKLQVKFATELLTGSLKVLVFFEERVVVIFLLDVFTF